MEDDPLEAAIREVRDRVRQRVAQGSASGITATDLMPLVHARDAAEAKVAAIGTVNPRQPGIANTAIQSVKRFVSRALDWHVREQVEFNRASMACVQATLEALTELSRGMPAYVEAWSKGFEERRTVSDIQLLRTVSELQSAFLLRVSSIEKNFHQALQQQHDDFTAQMDGQLDQAKNQLWADMAKIREEYERIIYNELRVLRQKQNVPQVAAVPISSPAPPARPVIDGLRFADIFRGTEEHVRAQQQRYVTRFKDADGTVLDLGCGRGEFLELARAADIAARGIDSDEECIALCRSKGLDAERADLFAYLDSLEDSSLGGAYCSQVIEHLPPASIPGLIQLISRKLRPGAMLAMETPNPECLAIFATHFYIDPTHTRPIPPVLLSFYLEEAGFSSMEIERLTPAVDSMPALADLPASVREKFFGGLDYAAFARKL